MSLSKNKILITGSNGLLGQALRRGISKKKSIIIATGKGSDKMRSNDHKYLKMDIDSSEDCLKVLEKYQPNIIINAAALTAVDECELNRVKCLNINSNSLLNLIPYCYKENAHLIHMSTDFVFDGEKGFYSEEDRCQPVNYYGYSKYESEKLIINKKINFTIIRTSLVYDVDSDINNFFYRIKDGLKNGLKLNIVNDQYRTPTFVYDLVEAISTVIENKKYGTYHISSGERLSIYQIVCNIAKYYGYNLDLINCIDSKELNQIAKRPIDSSLLIDKAIKELDFKPTRLSNLIK